RQRDQTRIETGLTYRYDFALVCGAHGFGIDPVGSDGALCPHHHDNVRIIQRARDFRAEPVACAQPRLIPPYRAGAIVRLDGSRDLTCEVAVLRGVTDKNIGHFPAHAQKACREYAVKLSRQTSVPGPGRGARVRWPPTNQCSDSDICISHVWTAPCRQ